MIPEKHIEKISQLKDTFKVIIRMMKLIWNIDHRLFTLAAIFYLIPAILPFINAYIYKLIIDQVVKLLAAGSSDISGLLPLVGIRLVTYFAQDFSNNTQDLIERILFTKFPIDINQIFFGKLAKLDVQYYENSDFRNLLEKAREGFAFRPQRLYANSFYVISEFISLVIAFIAIARLNWFLIILICLVVIPEFFIQTQYSKFAWTIWGGNSALRKRFDYLTRMVQGFREVNEVKIFQLAGKFLLEMKHVQEKFYIDNKKILKKSYLNSLVFRSLAVLIFVGFELFVIMEALAKRLTLGDIGFYTGIVTTFHRSMTGFFRAINEVFESSLYVKHIFEVLDLQPTLLMPKNPVKLNSKKTPLIEFKNVDFAYPGSDQKILKDFNLTISPGEKVAFVGENGAGKSTIIKLLIRFYDVTGGEILINGTNIKEIDLDTWYKTIGVLFQDFNRYEDTVANNIGFGKIHEDSDLEHIIKAATDAGAHKMVTKFDKGYEQMLGRVFDEGIELSGGQWQKIALSRAFLRNAPVLVLDEPTASIDAKAESEIFGRVEKLSKDKTVIIISHRFSTVRNADKIYVIDNGKISEAGTHQELMKLDNQYATLFKLQAKGYQ